MRSDKKEEEEEEETPGMMMNEKRIALSLSLSFGKQSKKNVCTYTQWDFGHFSEHIR